jgi:galactonate dehydratase
MEWRGMQSSTRTKETDMDFRITEIERVTVDVPFTEVAGRNMRRQLAGWSVSEVLQVKTNVGLVGIGETIVNYTWARVPENALRETIGKNPFELLYRDDLGAGLQIALWDLAGKLAGVPTYTLLGRKVRDAAPIAWWCIDMPAEDWALEAQRAMRLGYTDFKLKGRPWFDIVEQIGAVCRVVPDTSRIDVDFNEFLLDADNALTLLPELEEFPNVHIFESPIPQRDVEGNQRLRSALRSQVAHHYGSPPVVTAVKEGVCDGFVLCCGANLFLSHARTAEQLNMPFWIQLVGTGITTTWALHLGLVLNQAKWPAITCLNVYEEQLLAEAVAVSDGHARVSERPGLGIELDADAIARLRVEPPVEKRTPRWIHTVRFDAGPTVHFKDYGAYQTEFHARRLPPNHRRVRLETWEDDGSPAFDRLFRQVQDGPVRIEG